MSNMTNALHSAPSYNELESHVRDVAQQGVASFTSWLDSAWNKTLLILSTAFPVPGDGMH